MKFSEFVKLRENWNLGSDGANEAIAWLMTRLHGATGETIDELLNSPDLPNVLMGKFGLSPHEVQEPIQAARKALNVK